MIPFVLVICLISTIFTQCPPGTERNIEKTVQIDHKEALKLMQTVSNSPECRADNYRRVCGKGYSYWNAQTNIKYYRGIERLHIKKFLEIVFRGTTFPQEDKQDLIDLFGDLEFAAGIDVVGEDVLFNRKFVDQMGSFFLVYAEPNCFDADTIDFLLFRIESHFQLAADVFVLEQCSGTIFSRNCEADVIKRNKDLSKRQLQIIRAYFQISSLVEVNKALKTMDGI